MQIKLYFYCINEDDEEEDLSFDDNDNEFPCILI